MADENWALKAIESAAMARAAQHFDWSRVRMFGLGPEQILALVDFYETHTAKLAINILKDKADG